MTRAPGFLDIFAGGGGASEGIHRGTGRPVTWAVNHNPKAIAMHAANHPETEHFTEDVWRWNFRKHLRGRPLAGIWASPDCTQYSRAKGGKPVQKKIRSLAWIVPRILAGIRKHDRPVILYLENVVEFAEWGPVVPRWRCRGCKWKGTEGQMRLAARSRHRGVCPKCDDSDVFEERGKDGKPLLVPDPKRKGITFRRWLGKLRALGYDRIEWKNLDAADWGAPTHRRRLFLIARRDGRPVVWTDRTHIDRRKIEAAADLFISLRPYAIAAGCIDWSLPVYSIFMTPEEVRALNLKIRRPLAEPTDRRIAFGVKRYVLDNPEPFIVPLTHQGERAGVSVSGQFPTITGANRGELALIAPSITQYNTQKGDEVRGQPVDGPFNTIVGDPRFGLVAATMIQTGYGERPGQAPRTRDLEQPMGAAVDGCKQALCYAFMAKHFGGHETPGISPDRPFDTITGQDHHALVAANVVHLNNGVAHSSLEDPMRTVMAGGGHAVMVYSFLSRYFGNGIGSMPDEPVGTATAKDRTALVYVTCRGQRMILSDIGMRMFVPRELARGNGFRDSYVLVGSKSDQIRMIGNSVPPCMPEVLTRANDPYEAWERMYGGRP